MDVFSLFQYSFVQRALFAGVFIAILCAVLGVFLVLRKLSLIGDGLAHVSFGGVALGLFLGIFPTYTALPVVVLGSLLILKLTEKTKIFGDAAIGIVSAVGISGGVILASLGGGFNIDLMSYLFGNILAISQGELILSVFVVLLVMAMIVIFFRDLFAMTFDESYARTLGIKTKRINAIFFIITGVAVVLTIQLVGVLLVSALLILPATTALQVAKSFGGVISFAVLFAALSVIFGIFISFLLDIPTGAMIVLLSFFGFIVASGIKVFRRAQAL